MTEWYAKIAGETVGPMSSKNLSIMAASGHVQPDTPVRRRDDGAWVTAERVNGLVFPTSPYVAAPPTIEARSEPVTEPEAPPEAAPVAPKAAKWTRDYASNESPAEQAPIEGALKGFIGGMMGAVAFGVMAGLVLTDGKPVAAVVLVAIGSLFPWVFACMGLSAMKGRCPTCDNHLLSGLFDLGAPSTCDICGSTLRLVNGRFRAV